MASTGPKTEDYTFGTESFIQWMEAIDWMAMASAYWYGLDTTPKTRGSRIAPKKIDPEPPDSENAGKRPFRLPLNA